MKNKKRKDRIAIITLVALACIPIIIILTTTVIIPGYKNYKYNSAFDLFHAGKFNEAITVFESLNGYRDSTMQITKCKTAIKDKEIAIKDAEYRSASLLYDIGKYDEAIAAFMALGGYRDSLYQITKCADAIKDKKYNAAISLIKNGKYNEAYEALIALNNFKDSAVKAKKIFEWMQEIEMLKVASIGDIMYFGAYEQDNNISNGKEDIEWLVLTKEDNKVLVISRYALDCQQYDEINAIWETCSLRKWLNETFLCQAFSPEEIRSIISSTVTADKNPSYSTSPGNNTTDKVFLLSINEVDKYFNSCSSRQCRVTEYCYAYGNARDNYTCWWWLRSPGGPSNFAIAIDYSGDIYHGIDVIDVCAVRPAMWISLEK